MFPEARGVVAEHFELLRGAVYGMWALGLLAFLLAPLMLARDLGSRVSFRPRAIRDALFVAGGRPLERAVAIGMIGNVIVLACSPIGLALGEHYTWPVFVGHTLASVLVLFASGLGSIAQVRALLQETASAPKPQRASFAQPASF